MLIVVEDGNLHGLLERLFEVEAFRSFDVLEVDAAKREFQQLAQLDHVFRIVAADFEIKHVHVGKPLKQHALPFHHGFPGKRSDITQPEYRRPVAHHRDQLSPCRVLKASCGFFSISRQGMATPGV